MPVVTDIPDSPFRTTLGMTIVACEVGTATVVAEPLPTSINYMGQLHGGVVGALIDTAGALAGCRSADGGLRKAVTLSYTVNFIGAPTSAIRAVASSRGGGRKSFTSTVEVFDSADQLVAVGQGVYRYVNEQERT